MPYRGIFFEKNQPFHIVSRAVEGIKIFKQEEECYRFIFLLQCANLGRRGFNIKGKDIIKSGEALLHGESIPQKFITIQHPPLVRFLDFAFVITHYHLFIVPNVENSVPIFVQKLNNSFAKYYNLKHKRKGALFGDRYKSILVKTELQLDAVSRYVSIINPLDVYQPDWREKGLENWEEAFKFLEDYQFSSFPDKIGKRSSWILAPKEILERYSVFYKNREECRKFVEEFLEQKSAPSFFLE